MKNTKEAFLILGDQLFPNRDELQGKIVFMAEDVGLCTHYKYHKHKIAFFLGAMRTYAEELRKDRITVHYEELSENSYIERLSTFLKKEKIEKVTHWEVQDKFFEKDLAALFAKLALPVEVLESPMFLCSRQEFKNYLFYHQKPFMKSFYEKERKRLGILMTQEKKPEGGKWSFDVENRKKAPKVIHAWTPSPVAENRHFKAVKALVNERFSDHPGDLEDFWLPLDRAGSLERLDHFLNHHLQDFGDYQDSITDRHPFLYHALLSPMINAGLLIPEEVIFKAIIARQENPEIPLHSLEGFIRQIMGWREFVRGIYQNFSEVEEERNFFKHKRKLTKAWYDGTTGILPVDDAIKKARRYGYCHHIERLMLLSNVMLLSELDPREVHRWFMEMFVDSADWVMGPNVYGMGQFSDGGVFATKPYVSGSNYVLKMSDYKKGDWCEVWDGLFWRFIGKHEKFFSQNPRLGMMVRTLSKMDPAKKKRLEEKAQVFLDTMTGYPE